MERVPDGFVRIRKANKKEFSYKFAINDVNYFFYHRNNGVTKTGLIDEESPMVDEGKTTYFINTIDGAIKLSDNMNHAYINEIFNDTHILTG